MSAYTRHRADACRHRAAALKSEADAYRSEHNMALAADYDEMAEEMQQTAAEWDAMDQEAA